ncbi:MAG: DUF3343 domain-containing protein [Veillonella sp.]|nr:DUF3343 domain-containing protein [Veillonella sp.]
MENKKLLVVFTSYYFGDKADKILTELEVPHQLMATPPELYDMCGLSVQIDPSIVEQVQTIHIKPRHRLGFFLFFIKIWILI